MNWTTGSHRSAKHKMELQKQREFFSRKRLKQQFSTPVCSKWKKKFPSTPSSGNSRSEDTASMRNAEFGGVSMDLIALGAIEGFPFRRKIKKQRIDSPERDLTLTEDPIEHEFRSNNTVDEESCRVSTRESSSPPVSPRRMSDDEPESGSKNAVDEGSCRASTHFNSPPPTSPRRISDGDPTALSARPISPAGSEDLALRESRDWERFLNTEEHQNAVERINFKQEDDTDSIVTESQMPDSPLNVSTESVPLEDDNDGRLEERSS
ncbi:hypothetical protein, variant [Spizellomyces punctatus DAOM BR117]|uniref:Uncharacterized protein n=1 Tax=Spizellomyces punctatus (strain DAOM BR117) TaxID=645134 RepID=A0A0L0H7U1_SPIPD|nr:hypothetical protein, variant [Spizellomyces punctatus DAOM BR117]KNC97297.1 hypothetical protein, variant [Spizellomyces punctatus DAOM BR117]|eukprot:XP_016605337.1 hypothetical protein, variant [Spizellomyces punctatus DAOM BR117]